MLLASLPNLLPENGTRLRRRELNYAVMEVHWIVFYLFISVSLVFAAGNNEFVRNNEVSALLTLKAGVIDPLERLKDWVMPSNVAGDGGLLHCRWTGVSCNSAGLVEKLDLSNLNLSGTVSDSINDLHSLAFLNISCNGFDSSLPASLSNVSSLKNLDVSENNFVGKFPAGLGTAWGLTSINASSNNFSGFLPEDLGNATKLEVIDFRGSFFEGSVPLSFKNLKNLKFLGLSGNNLTGKLPQELGELSSLETLIIGYNEFEGEIPSGFGNLANLRYLDLAFASFSGQIPPELGKLKNLTTVYLYTNRFSGKIPPEILNISSLVFLDLSDNQISGEIPAEIGNLKNLQLLNLMCNNLSGLIPNTLAELTKLEVLALWKNSFTGSLPENLGLNSPLQWLDVSSNSLSGEIPSGLCYSGNLTKLILFNNSFSGSIPKNLSMCSSLVRVRLQDNLLSGTIPDGFGKLPSLQRLELASNELNGQIPEDFALSTSLSFIDVSFNHLELTLPSSLLSIPNLQNLIASNNNLKGDIPDEFQGCPSLSVLDLSHNQLSGTIPESIGSCAKLVNLNLRSNKFFGEIPKVLATMPTLAILDLSNNSLTGQIPENFGSSPALEMLNVSYNKLEGPVPTNGILMSINPSDLAGNSGLCGSVLPPCTKSFQSMNGRMKNTRNFRVLIGFVIAILVLLVLVISFFAGRSLYRRWYLYNSFLYDWFKKSNEEWPWRLVAFQRVNFTSSDILACIKESNVIGMGGTGIVYKAETYRPNGIVAVKKLWGSGSDIEKGNDLLGEVNLLGRLRHRNIVRLIGYLHNNRDVMILYEYMSNGNLGTALHGKGSGKLLVDWVSRYNIAVGVAQGMNYLHHDCHPPIIHRDIKTNNILLDENLEARIADFGLARMMIHKNESVSIVAGSYGYIAPEYGYTTKVDEKSDIYSYGVVLLELLTGKMPSESEFGEALSIVEWVRRKLNKRDLERALDPEIVANCKHVEEEMLLVLRIALLCTAKLPKDRPSMRDIITMLGEAKPRRKSLCNNGGIGGQIGGKEKTSFGSISPVSLLL